MADITMCLTEGCPRSAMCYRKQATPNESWQSMCAFRFSWVNKKFCCDSYLYTTEDGCSEIMNKEEI
jgi:hypothetical protein